MTMSRPTSQSWLRKCRKRMNPRGAFQKRSKAPSSRPYNLPKATARLRLGRSFRSWFRAPRRRDSNAFWRLIFGRWTRAVRAFALGDEEMQAEEGSGYRVAETLEGRHGVQDCVRLL